MSVLAYYLICDFPTEIGLEEFTQRTTMKSRTENKTVENRKDYIITMLCSPFLWVLSAGHLLTLFDFWSWRMDTTSFNTGNLVLTTELKT